MKIIHIIRNFNNGGAERVVVDLSNQMSLHEMDVTVVRFCDDPKLNFFLSDLSERVNVVTIKRRGKYDLFLPFRILLYVARKKPDIVNTHLNESFVFTILSFILVRRVSYFHTIHSMPIKEARNKFGLYLRRFLFKYFSVTPIAIADEVFSQGKVVYGIDNFPLIYNGRSAPLRTEKYEEVKVFTDALRSKNDSNIILNVGRYAKVKNQIMLCRAIQSLNNQGFNLKLLVIGSEQSKEVWDELNSFSSEDIIFLGRKDNVQDYLECCDFFSLSSKWEGMPISLIEAFAMGCVPVCTPAGGISSMVDDGVNGFLSNDFSSLEFEGTLRKCLQLSKEKLRTISEAGIDTFNKYYNIEQCSSRYLEVYNQHRNMES